jgi:hypothetical protein
MDAMQIVSGFSDIKKQFRAKTKMNKSQRELSLAFSFQDGFFCVHDFWNRKVTMELAWYDFDRKNWKSFLNESSLGERLFWYFVELSKGESAKVRDKAEELFDLYGFFIIRL